MPLVHKTMDPEDAHKLAIWLARNGLSPIEKVELDDKSLEVDLFGRTLRNPIGLAAGFDKNGEAIDAMFDMGFAQVEIGSVVPRSQPGNAKPRMFRLSDDSACINRYGMNCEGFDPIESRLRSRVHSYLRANPSVSLDPSPSSVEAELSPLDVPRSLRKGRMLGINLARNKDQPVDSNADYVEGVKRMGPYADYVVLNVSCPNQHGITSMQRKGIMESLMKEIVATRDMSLPHRPPVLVKLSPDLQDDELQDVARAVLDSKVDGVIISNTTNQRPESLKSAPSLVSEWGGLSGPPLKPLSLSLIRRFRHLTSSLVPIIGCGGITSGSDAIEYARAGASAVQVYTGVAYGGPGLVAKVKNEVKEELKRRGKTWMEVVGEEEG
ncbi:Dihydroorotate dehydrogenase (quinone), mitochondrial [Gonapodya sp. JEL0774]|nr:Dihydroorotate dehydrogenase (quinone), mitochondrial [Gonapodya sp. JEL0774]